MKPSDIAPHRLRWNSHIKKMCLVSIFAAVLTAPAADAVAAPDEVSGIPSITDGDSIRIGKSPYPHPRDRCPRTTPAVPVRPRGGAALRAGLHACACSPCRPADGAVLETRCRPLRSSGRPVFRRQHRSRRGAGATGLGGRLPQIFAGLCSGRRPGTQSPSRHLGRRVSDALGLAPAKPAVAPPYSGQTPSGAEIQAFQRDLIALVACARSCFTAFSRASPAAASMSRKTWTPCGAKRWRSRARRLPGSGARQVIGKTG